MSSIDTNMGRLCNRIMGATQQTIDTLQYTLDEMNYIAENNPERDDVKACIEEIKTKIKAAEAEHWVCANKWSEHFDGINQDDEDDE